MDEQDSHARKAKDGSYPHGVHSKTAWLKLIALFSWEALRLQSSRPAEVYNNWLLQWQAVSTLMPHSLGGNSTSLPIIELIQKTHWLSLTQRKRPTVSKWLTLTDRTHTACLCSATCAWQLMPRSWYSQHDKTSILVNSFHVFSACLHIISHPWEWYYLDPIRNGAWQPSKSYNHRGPQAAAIIHCKCGWQIIWDVNWFMMDLISWLWSWSLVKL